MEGSWSVFLESDIQSDIRDIQSERRGVTVSLARIQIYSYCSYSHLLLSAASSR